MPRPALSTRVATMDRREYDENGFLLVRNNPISKEGVFPYYGREINAPEPDRIYYVYRPASELSRPETLQSFNLLPLINDHEMLGTNATPAESKGVQGATGEAAVFDAPYLRNSIRVYSERLKQLISSGKVQLSPAYRCRYVFKQGTWNGQRYDAIQTDIRANHLALVDQGRTGPDVAILDSYPIGVAESPTQPTPAEGNMILTEEQIEALRALGYSDEAIAEIAKALGAKLPDTEAEAEAGETESAEDAEPTEHAAEAGPDSAQAAPPQWSEETWKRVQSLIGRAVAASLKQSTTQAKAESKAPEPVTMDALVRQLTRRDQLAAALRPHIGTFDTAAMPSEEAVAEYACKKLGIQVPAAEALGAVRGFLHHAASQAKNVTSDAQPMGASLINTLWSE